MCRDGMDEACQCTAENPNCHDDAFIAVHLREIPAGTDSSHSDFVCVESHDMRRWIRCSRGLASGQHLFPNER